MTTNRELYDTIVAEVEQSYPLLWEYKEDEMPNEEGGYVQYELFEGLTLDAPMDVFSNYTVRDALMVKANQDDKFTFVLCNKIIHTAKEADEKGSFTLHELEGLATVTQMLVMWEQTDRAISIGQTAQQCAEENNLELPSLMSAAARLIQASIAGFDMTALRANMVASLNDTMQKELDK